MTNATTTNTPLQQLDKFALINLSISIWSGQSKLLASELELGDGGKLPSEKVALLGNKKICDPAQLKVFKTLKEQARRALQNVGLPLLGGYAVPLAELDNVLKILEDIKRKFVSAKHAFLSSYDKAIQDWIADNPSEAELIRGGVKDVRDVADRITADYQVFQAAPMAGASEGLARASGGMSGDLIEEVKDKVGKFYDKYIVKADAADRRTRTIFGHLAKKVSGLAFLDSRFDALQQLLEDTEALYGRTDGPIAGSDFQELRANALILSTDRIQDYLEKGAVDDTWAEMDDNADDLASDVTQDEVEVDVDMEASASDDATTEPAPAQEANTDNANDDPFAALDALLNGDLFETSETEDVSEPKAEAPLPEVTATEETAAPEKAPIETASAAPEFIEEFVEVPAASSAAVTSYDPDDFEEVLDEEVEESFDW